jgi:hypothetical protein
MNSTLSFALVNGEGRVKLDAGSVSIVSDTATRSGEEVSVDLTKWALGDKRDKGTAAGVVVTNRWIDTVKALRFVTTNTEGKSTIIDLPIGLLAKAPRGSSARTVGTLELVNGSGTVSLTVNPHLRKSDNGTVKLYLMPQFANPGKNTGAVDVADDDFIDDPIEGENGTD